MKSFHAAMDGEWLYCNLHFPPTRLVHGTGVVLCAPLGHEYYRSYRALAKLAEHLSSRGHIVARFDYRGIGDSAGNAGGYSLSDRIDDASLAVTTLCDSTPLERVLVIGMRFGALVADGVAARLPIARAVHWEPLRDGRQWLSELGDLNDRVLADLDRFAREREASDCSNSELVGYIYGSRLLEEVRELRAGHDAPMLETGKDYGWNDARRVGEIIVDPAVNRRMDTLLEELAA